MNVKGLKCEEQIKLWNQFCDANHYDMDYIWTLKQWAEKYPKTIDFIMTLKEFDSEEAYIVVSRFGKALSVDGWSALEMCCDYDGLEKWLSEKESD